MHYTQNYYSCLGRAGQQDWRVALARTRLRFSPHSAGRPMHPRPHRAGWKKRTREGWTEGERQNDEGQSANSANSANSAPNEQPIEPVARPARPVASKSSRCGRISRKLPGCPTGPADSLLPLACPVRLPQARLAPCIPPTASHCSTRHPMPLHPIHAIHAPSIPWSSRGWLSPRESAGRAKVCLVLAWSVAGLAWSGARSPCLHDGLRRRCQDPLRVHHLQHPVGHPSIHPPSSTSSPPPCNPFLPLPPLPSHTPLLPCGLAVASHIASDSSSSPPPLPLLSTLPGLVGVVHGVSATRVNRPPHPPPPSTVHQRRAVVGFRLFLHPIPSQLRPATQARPLLAPKLSRVSLEIVRCIHTGSAYLASPSDFSTFFVPTSLICLFL